ncbi:ribonuclease III [Candidatus Woesebacteria bacterium]|nr:ribonuclease III [Candidatus Woesebacteria bacterium]
MLPTFTDSQLLERALTHRSALNERGSAKKKHSYERLEYLGDAVLELAVSDFLFAKFPTEPEGTLTSYRSALVKTETLAMISTRLELGKMLHMSKGEEQTGGRENKGILADVFEAIVGALYLDQGFPAVVLFLQEVLFPELTIIMKTKSFQDSKSALQEKVQSLGFPTPMYRLVEAIGPDHSKQFTVEVLINGKPGATGSGSSKQQAQQHAAQTALEEFDWGLYNSPSS